MDYVTNVEFVGYFLDELDNDEQPHGCHLETHKEGRAVLAQYSRILDISPVLLEVRVLLFRGL